MCLATKTCVLLLVICYFGMLMLHESCLQAAAVHAEDIVAHRWGRRQDAQVFDVWRFEDYCLVHHIIWRDMVVQPSPFV